MKSNLLLILFLSSGFAHGEVHLPTIYNCLNQTRNATGNAATADALVLKLGSTAYIVNAAKILKVTKPAAEQMPDGKDVNILTEGQSPRYSSIRNGAVTFYTGNKSGLPEVNVTEAKMKEADIAVLISNEIMTRVAKDPKNTDYARIFSACKRIPKLDLPKDWAQKEAPKRDTGWEDSVWGDKKSDPPAGR